MSLQDAVTSGSRRTELEGVRDLLVKELEVNRCKSCEALKIRMSDTASIVGKLLKVLEDLSRLPNENAEEVDPIEALQEAVGMDTNILPFDPSDRQKVRKTRDG